MPATNLTVDTDFSLFQGGIAGVAATGPVKRIIIGGTWVAEDLISLTINYNDVQYDVGSKSVTQADISYVTAVHDQIMFCAGDKLFFSGIAEPTGFENRYAGYGYITMSGERGEAVKCLAVVPYAGKLALFARNNIQLWAYNPDPTMWNMVQSLENVGTCSPKSVVSYGELDVFFLSDSGLRSLRARQYTDLVNVRDVGTAIDVTIQGLLKALTEEAKQDEVLGYFNSMDGRYWLIIGATIFIFSYFPGSEVAAWSTYQQEYWNHIAWEKQRFIPQWTAGKGGIFYILDCGAAGNGDARTLGAYPGNMVIDVSKENEIRLAEIAWRNGTYTDAQYYAQLTSIEMTFRSARAIGHHSNSTVLFSFFDAKQPATRKLFTAVDIIGTGTWEVQVGNDTNDETLFTTVIKALPLSTLKFDRVPLGFYGTHVLLQLKSLTDEEAIIGSVIFHWEPCDAS